MKFDVVGVNQDNEEVVLRRPPGQDDPIPLEPGMDAEVAPFENEPDLARYLAAVTEAKRARQYHEELRLGNGAHAEDRALSLLLGEIDP